MDNRLTRVQVQTKRAPGKTFDVSLPELARALVAAVRRQGSVRSIAYKGLRYVWLVGLGVDIAIPASDWAKILPLLKDGTFDPNMFPVETGIRPGPSMVRLSASTTDIKDPLYDRVLFYLQQLFPDKVPT